MIFLGVSFSVPANSAGKPLLRVGLSYGDTLVWMSDAALGGALDDAVRVGAKWVRADLSWQDLASDGPGEPRWALFDRVLAAARARGLSMLPVLAYTPSWARPAGCTQPTCGPADASKFAAFARDAAQRYAPLGVHSWEVWNEPNLGFWKPAPDPVAYTGLLIATSRAVRGADPAAKIVLGGLAATTTGKNRYSQLDFLTQVCKLGGNRVVDAVGYHPYTYPYLPGTRTRFGTAWEKIDESPVTLRSVLKAFGTPHLPVWVTEIGAPTGGPGTVSDGSVRSITSRTTHVTEKRQAQIAAAAVTSASGDRDIQGLFWYADRDLSTEKDSNENFFGLRRADGSAKPAYRALMHAIAGVDRPQR
ncbi:cellulase family glycosylhydrolase [Actinoplanes sp. NPDC051343]|uniref:cellulase family glycosylhydrolase n=1 Tax=Actinoplanes sp. NPDC051343 TaxID=3363906 RepID=UPI0037B16C9C